MCRCTVAWQIRSWRFSYLVFQFYELSMLFNSQIYFGTVADVVYLLEPEPEVNLSYVT